MDIELHYTETGAGETLVLLHGNGESGAYFARQVEYFSRSYRVVTVDTRGHGGSPRGNAPFTISQFANDLYDFFGQRGIERAHLLGFSDGANVALTFALRHQELLHSLILNGANLNPAGVKPEVQLPIELGYRITGAFADKNEEARHSAELLRLMVMEPHIRPESLYALKVPTLVIVGSRDLIKLSHSRLICGSIEDARLVMIKGDHFVAAKNPGDFNREVDNFMRELKTRSR